MTKIKCLFNNPDMDTYTLSNMGIDVSDDSLIEREVYFYTIDCLVPRVDSDGSVCGTVIHSRNVEYYSLISIEEIDKLIRG